MNKTKIDWPWKPLYTWNPITGCMHNCSYCYAKKIANRFPEKFGGPGFKPVFHKERLKDPGLKDLKPRNIFVGSMADVFGQWVSSVWIETVLNTMREHAQHTYILLTKNPVRYLDFDFTGINVWLGVTVECGDRLIARALGTAGVVMNVKHHEGFKTFMSVEPILGEFKSEKLNDFFDLVIVGAMTGKKNPPVMQSWIDSIKHNRIYFKNTIKRQA